MRVDYGTLKNVQKLVEREAFYCLLYTVVGGRGKYREGRKHLNNMKENAQAFNTLSGLPMYALK